MKERKGEKLTDTLKISNPNDEEREQFLRQKTEPKFPGKFYAG